MDNQLIQRLFTSFESITLTVGGVECWSARELQDLLGYSDWRNFNNVIDKAKTACNTINEKEKHHFVDTTKTIPMPKGATKEVPDIMLTRYACYLIAQNGDSSKPPIAFAMTYFAVQTRNQEIIQKRLSDIDRIKAREKLTETENMLSGIIYQRGVDNKGFGNIRSKGDHALFGGFTTAMMKRKLKMPEGRALADFLPTVTIKAKDLATEMTNVNVVDKNLKGETLITKEHIENNKAVRDALGQRDIIPEKLPVADDLQKIKRKLESENKKVLKESKHLSENNSLNISKSLTDEEINELYRIAELEEIETEFQNNLDLLEREGYEYGGEIPCDNYGGDHNAELWANSSGEQARVCKNAMCRYVER